jgi:putative spermidine/putrescine transport system ATP-binding protein
MALLAEGEAAENVVGGVIAGWSYLGAGYALNVKTPDFGALRVTLPTWNAPIAPREGLAVRVGWAASASVPVADDAA